MVVDRDNVSRAIGPADLIRRGGRKVLPAVAREVFTEGAEFVAGDRKVLLFSSGAGDHWEDAIQRWIKRPRRVWGRNCFQPGKRSELFSQIVLARFLPGWGYLAQRRKAAILTFNVQ